MLYKITATKPNESKVFTYRSKKLAYHKIGWLFLNGYEFSLEKLVINEIY
jgi:hypothetical protein